MERISREEYYFEIAKAVSLRSACLRRQVGAVIIRDGVILSTGYNGPPRGDPHCEFCIRDANGYPHGKMYDNCPAVHAEENAIINAALHGINIRDADMYLYGGIESIGPCDRCMRLIKTTGLKVYVNGD